MFECRGCGAILPGRKNRQFCSNACQRAAERRANVARWLASGQGIVDSAPEHYIRSYILADQLGHCAVCDMDGTWNGRPLVLVLDHIDGDSTNNRRENLRLVCPNCDSQLPTYKARDKGRGRAWRRERYANGQSY